jgi:hypothetical protein
VAAVSAMMAANNAAPWVGTADDNHLMPRVWTRGSRAPKRAHNFQSQQQLASGTTVHVP